MCFRNCIEYICPAGHVRLNNITPFTLCGRAQHGVIQRQCDEVVSRVVKSEEWCIDCETRREEVMREVLRNIESKGKRRRYAVSE